MEPSGGADHRRREREPPLLHNGAVPLFAAHQTLPHHHLSDDIRESACPDLSNPDPVSFAFAAPSSGPPSMDSPAPARPKPKMPPPQQQQEAVKYRECLRNHAASVGGSVFDGCGEFMPAGEVGTQEAFKCAACDCHRNFHRKETDDGGGYRRSLPPLQLPAPPPSIHHPRPYSSSVSIVPAPMRVSYGGGTESSSEELNLSSEKKRFRTKFTQEQREKMMEFAEKIGWRIQREREEEIERFCAEAGVMRQVFKVWMHNNKNSSTSSTTKSSSSPPKPSQPDDHQQF